ncbi:MAG: hypothetical protein KDD44_11950, partial [Bdellovibrionales bacterium]|nr:hypothetical protein [Bdellovibrionales bacterium]
FTEEVGVLKNAEDRQLGYDSECHGSPWAVAHDNALRRIEVYEHRADEQREERDVPRGVEDDRGSHKERLSGRDALGHVQEIKVEQENRYEEEDKGKRLEQHRRALGDRPADVVSARSVSTEKK